MFPDCKSAGAHISDTHTQHMGFPVSCRSCFSLSPPLPLNEEPVPAVHQQVCLNILSGPFVPGQHAVACTYLGRTLGVIFCKSMLVFCFCFFHLFFEWERGVQGGSVGGARPKFLKVARDTLLTRWRVLSRAAVDRCGG